MYSIKNCIEEIYDKKDGTEMTKWSKGEDEEAHGLLVLELLEEQMSKKQSWTSRSSRQCTCK